MVLVNITILQYFRIVYQERVHVVARTILTESSILTAKY